jgi:hypothetical protein
MVRVHAPEPTFSVTYSNLSLLDLIAVAGLDHFRSALPSLQIPCTVPANRNADAKLRTFPRREATFIEPMECLATAKLPDRPQWVYEIKLDGYRALAVKNNNGVTLFSSRNKSLNKKFLYKATNSPSTTVPSGRSASLDKRIRISDYIEAGGA